MFPFQMNIKQLFRNDDFADFTLSIRASGSKKNIYARIGVSTEPAGQLIKILKAIHKIVHILKPFNEFKSFSIRKSNKIQKHDELSSPPIL